MMWREPEEIPAAPGVFALVNGRRRCAYVSYTSNLQKRSHSMSHMLMERDADPRSYWPIRDLPKHPSGEFTFRVMRVDDEVDRRSALSAVAAAQRHFVAKGWRIVRGHRVTSPVVVVGGRRMSLAEAVRTAGDGTKYLTAYRRLERGWTVRQALGLDAPAPRWHKPKQKERTSRESARERLRERVAA